MPKENDGMKPSETPTPPYIRKYKHSGPKSPNALTDEQWAEIDKRMKPEMDKFREELRRMFSGDFSVLDEPL